MDNYADQITSSNGSTMTTTDKRVIDFIKELKQAIENGEFQQHAKYEGNDANTETNNDNEDRNKIMNVNNLSNQTFNYIINWLKQQSQVNEVNLQAPKNLASVQNSIEVKTTTTTIELNNENNMLNIDRSMDIKFSNSMFKNGQQLNNSNNFNTSTSALSDYALSKPNSNYIEKVRKLEAEKHNLIFQVQLLQQQLGITQKNENFKLQQQQSNNSDLTTSNKNAYLMKKLIQSKELLNTPNGMGNGIDHTQKLDSLAEIQYLKTQLKILEQEKEIFNSRLKECQEENSFLKLKLNKFLNENSFANGNSIRNGHCNESSNSELDKLRQTIKELVKLNEEKDKKIDELNKQVLRFKRIQDIVLSAQPVKAKNLEIDFDNSDSNSIPSINSDRELKEQNILGDRTLLQHQTQQPLRFFNNLNQNCMHDNLMNKSLNSNYQDLVKYSSCDQIQLTSSSTSNSTSSCSQSSNNQMQSKAANSNSSALTKNDVILAPPTVPPPQLPSGVSPNQNMNHYNTLPHDSTIPTSKYNNIMTTSLIRPSNEENSSGSRGRNYSVHDINSGYISDGPSLKYSTNSTRISEKSSKLNSSTTNKSFRKFFGKLIRTSSGNIREGNSFDSEFKRGGLRATAGPRLAYDAIVDKSRKNIFDVPFAKWNTDRVVQWFDENGFANYVNECKAWVKNGLQLLQATQNDYEKHLGMKNALHRKKLYIYLQTLCLKNTDDQTKEEISNLEQIDTHWVIKWLDDIGVPQYKEYFQEAKIDGIMLYNLTNEDLINLNVHSEMHHLSVKRAIQVLRLNNFNPLCLKRRPTSDEKADKAEVMNWTNHRVMEWLRSVDLSEYAPNLRGSGVHGGLMIYEPRFNSTVLADILSIPSSKTLLRRHLNTHFIDLIGAENQMIKRETEIKPNYQPLSAANKIKLIKRGIFSHKRTKSQEPHEVLSQLESNQISFGKSNKLSILNQDHVPTSIV